VSNAEYVVTGSE